jgi:ABC-type nitrate/sulfonate/bicarbonate transport system permease component
MESSRPLPRGGAADRLLPFSGVAILLVAWDLAIRTGRFPLLPGPIAVARAIAELGRRGFLVKHVVASLFRVTWGYLLAVAVGVPLGIALAWYRRGGLALGPLVDLVRPISALAWIPIAILWFGVGDLSAIFIIFVASALPLAVSAAISGSPRRRSRAACSCPRSCRASWSDCGWRSGSPGWSWSPRK